MPDSSLDFFSMNRNFFILLCFHSASFILPHLPTRYSIQVAKKKSGPQDETQFRAEP